MFRSVGLSSGSGAPKVERDDDDGDETQRVLLFDCVMFCLVFRENLYISHDNNDDSFAGNCSQIRQIIAAVGASSLVAFAFLCSMAI